MKSNFNTNFPRVLCAWLLSAVVAQAESGVSINIDFDDMDTGLPPRGFITTLSGQGGPVNWIIKTPNNGSTSTNLLIQLSSETTSYRFPLCIYEDFSGKDVVLSVRFRPVSGSIDQAAGLVWRYQDENNYYIVRANALEDNVVLYKMENGKRSDLKPVGTWLFSYGKDVPVPNGQWHTLRVSVSGDKFSVYLNDDHLFDVIDGTFTGAGRVGFWTKADSVTEFDDFTINSTE